MPAMSGRVAVTGRLNELVERHATASSRRFLQESRHGPTLTPATETTTANPAGPMNVPPGGRVRQASSRSSSALPSHRNHHTPALMLWWSVLLREASWWASWWDPSMACKGSGGQVPQLPPGTTHLPVSRSGSETNGDG